MLVVADSSPLHYLILIECTEVLPALFDQIVIPDEVWKELTHPSAPGEVRSLLDEPAYMARCENPASD